jgi:hypothetical protein
MYHGLCPDEGNGACIVAVDEGIDIVPDAARSGAAGGLWPLDGAETCEPSHTPAGVRSFG